MAEIELAPLSHRLDDDEVKLLVKRLKEMGGGELDRSNDDAANQTIAARLSEEAMTEFLDRLDAHDIGAEIYVPLEFDGRATVGDYRVASTQALQDVLEEMKEELGVDDEEAEYEAEDEEEDDDEDEEDEDEDEGSVIEAQLRHIWHLVTDAAGESVDKNIPLHLKV